MAVYYVDKNHPSADDDNAGTSEAAPWLTLHRATDGYPSREVGGIAGSEPYTSRPVAGDTVWVKNGTYEDNRQTLEEPPKYGPTNSGTAGNPIAFRAYPGHSPVVTRWVQDPPATPQGNMPVIGASSVNYITWDGFTTGAYTDIRVISTTGTIIERCIVNKGTGINANDTGNYCGIFLRTTTDCHLRWNKILNVNDNNDSWQAVGIVTYDTTGGRIYQNEIGPNVTVSMHDKRGGQNNRWYLNWCHETTAQGIGFMLGSSGTSNPTSGIYVYNNVFDRIGEIGVYGPADQPDTSDVRIYNNTFKGIASSAGMRIGVIFNPQPDDAPTVLCYNNLIMRDETAVGSNYGHLVFEATVGPPADLVCNYNAFYGIATTNAVFRPAAGGGTETLAQWQARGYDLGSITSAPVLVGPFPATSADAYKPDTGSPLLGAGRTGGTSGGSAVNIGAFEIGDEVIGREPGAITPLVGAMALAGAAPRMGFGLTPETP